MNRSSGAAEHDQASTRIVVTKGGDLTDEELAALAVALTPSHRPENGRPPDRLPAWRRAAIVEGLGGRPFTSAPDLTGREPVARF